MQIKGAVKISTQGILLIITYILIMNNNNNFYTRAETSEILSARIGNRSGHVLTSSRLKSIGTMRTSLKKLIVDHKSIKMYWSFEFKLSSYASLQRINWTTTGAFGEYVPLKFDPIEWTIRVRKFASLYVKLRLISDTIDPIKLAHIGERSYHFEIDDIESGTAYEVCLQCKDFPVIDEDIGTVRRISMISTSSSGYSNNPKDVSNNVNRYIACKEVITESRLPAKQVAVVSAVSSASTLVVVVIFGFWCPKRRKKKKKSNKREEEEEEEEQEVDDNNDVNNNGDNHRSATNIVSMESGEDKDNHSHNNQHSQNQNSSVIRIDDKQSNWFQRCCNRLTFDRLFSSSKKSRINQSSTFSYHKSGEQVRGHFYQVKYSKIKYAEWIKRTKFRKPKSKGHDKLSKGKVNLSRVQSWPQDMWTSISLDHSRYHHHHQYQNHHHILAHKYKYRSRPKRAKLNGSITAGI
ncbi:uncharacterized protein LOC141852664 [Brevipalpus obovatus]|uniref:uncharacterized protein LOC141852664 n=1 Tax=Brevipalpus obovatus TaxID=246614 RepID=UPI003D9E4030